MHGKQPKLTTARKSSSEARLTASSEPILLPKLRISFADFPYLHYSMQPEAVHLGDLLRIWVRPSTKFTLTRSDFQGPATGHWTAQEVRCFTLSRTLSPDKLIPGCGQGGSLQRKDNSSQACRRRLRVGLRYRSWRGALTREGSHTHASLRG